MYSTVTQMSPKVIQGSLISYSKCIRNTIQQLLKNCAKTYSTFTHFIQNAFKTIFKMYLEVTQTLINIYSTDNQKLLKRYSTCTQNLLTIYSKCTQHIFKIN